MSTRAHRRPWSVAWGIYEVVWGLVIGGWYSFVRIRQREGWQEDVRERLGGLPKRPAHSSMSIWIHAVSVGEINSIRPVISEMKRKRPDAWILLTTSNAAAFGMAKNSPTGADALARTPWDARFCVRKALRRVRPDVLAIVECEIWPNLIGESARAGARVIMINARIYRRDFPTYRWAKPIFAPVLKQLEMVHTQSEEDRKRFLEMGIAADRVQFTGNTKYDLKPPALSNDARIALEHELGIEQRPVWVWASTHPDEEQRLLAGGAADWIRSAGLCLIIAPRDIRRAGDIVKLSQSMGLSARLRTSTHEGSRDILVMDTLGELSTVMHLADVVFVGGSLAPNGGHNPIEASCVGRPVIVGPHTWNFADVVSALREAGGLLQVNDAPEVVRESSRLLSDASHRARIGEAGRSVIERHRGSAVMYAELLLGGAPLRQAA